MKADVNGTQIELEPNSRPYLLKRIIADGFDTVLIFILFLAFFWLLLESPLSEKYKAHEERSRAIALETAAAVGNDAEALSKALNADTEYRDELLAANLQGFLLKAAACFPAEALVLLVFPLSGKYRTTPGKRMTGIMPFNERRRSRATWPQIVYRFLFVFLIDSLFLYFFTGGDVTFLLVPVLRLTEMLLNGKDHKTVCDFVTGIKIIEKLSYDGIN
ncbi:MAG: RDD family protein [Oscillospiraceae bacterium]|nr:RDD family protein [Oscillospiraceae bacterium]